MQELKRAAQELLPDADDEDANSETATTAQEDGGATNINQTFEALLKQLCKGKLTDAAKVEGPIGAWRVKHMSGVDDPRVLSFFNDVLPSVVARLVNFEDARIMMQKRKVFCTVALTFFDTLSDYSACWVLLKDGSGYGIAMLVVLIISMVSQAATARYLTREGPIATVGALLGLKPILDGVNIIFDIPPQPGALTSLVAFGFTRSMETATESIPFAVIQALALMQQRSVAQAVSFVITLANIAHTVVSVDHHIDTNQKSTKSGADALGVLSARLESKRTVLFDRNISAGVSRGETRGHRDSRYRVTWLPRICADRRVRHLLVGAFYGWKLAILYRGWRKWFSQYRDSYSRCIRV